MPLYEYRCNVCGHQFDQLAKMTDPNPPCPKVVMRTESSQAEGPPQEHDWPCGGETTKLISGSTFHLAGSGWAKDGYSG